MSILLTLQSIIEKIPMVIAILRDLIVKINLSPELNFTIFMAIAFIGAYILIQQFVISGWIKLKTIISLVLLTIIFYLTIVRA